jgi:NIPSNAP.
MTFEENPVDRRNFLAAAAVASVAPISTIEAMGQPAPRQFFELRRYHLLPGAKQRAFTTFIGDAAIPAMNRAGVSKVGAFTVVYGENAPSLLLVLVHQSLDSVVSLRDLLASDDAYIRAGAAVNNAPLSDPAFVRVESTLLRAFEAMPTLEPSAGAGTNASRIFEMRTYESHSDRAALNKRAMFNAGEVPIFRRTGLAPVFFGETIVGARMPSLTYMLTFSDMAARDAAWASFSKDADWKTLSADAQYKDNVSSISDIILRPTAYSQV